MKSGVLLACLFVALALAYLRPEAPWLLGGDWKDARATVVKIDYQLRASRSGSYDNIHYRYEFAGRTHNNTYRRKHTDVRVGDEISIIVNAREPGESAKGRFDFLFFSGPVVAGIFVLVGAVVLGVLSLVAVQGVRGWLAAGRLHQRAELFEAEERSALHLYHAGQAQEAMRRFGRLLEIGALARRSEEPGSGFHKFLSLTMLDAHARLAKLHREGGNRELGESHARKAQALAQDAGADIAIPEQVFDYIDARDERAGGRV